MQFDKNSNALVVKDAGSKNGTFFGDGRRIGQDAKYELKHGDTFYLAAKNDMFIVNIY